MDGNESETLRRKRKYSGSATLTSKEISANRHRYGETILLCVVYINKGIRELGNEIVLKYTCALLNSGGGILHMRNVLNTRGVTPKDLDTWWSAMENKMADIISSDDICNYFDLVGNYDDEDLYLFVKSAEHLCTLDYHSRLPTDTATHEVSYQSAMKLLIQTGEPSSLSELPEIPTDYYYRKTHKLLKQETKQIQFKQLSAPSTKEGKSLPSKFKYMVSKYLSAFANHEGGHIYFGIEDVRAAVVGEELTEEDEQKTVRLLTDRMDPVIWGSTDFKPLRGIHWDIQFHQVKGVPHRMGRRVVVVVSVCKFPGGVFTSTPDSYFVDEKGEVEPWKFKEWREALLSRHRDKPELHSRFVKLEMNVPQAPLIFTLTHTIESIKQKLLNCILKRKKMELNAVNAISQKVVKGFSEEFYGSLLAKFSNDNDSNKVSLDIQLHEIFIPLADAFFTILLPAKKDWLQPRHALDNILQPEVKDFILKTVELYREADGICICVNCWGLQVSHSPPGNVLCDIFLLSRTRGCHLLTFTDSDNPVFPNHSYLVASFLKSRLVLRGGCNEKFGIVCHVINVTKCLSQKPNKSDVDTAMDIDEDERMGPVTFCGTRESSFADSHGKIVDSGKESRSKSHIFSDFYDPETIFSHAFYPSHFNMNSRKYSRLVEALIIYMAAYEPVDFTTLAGVKREDVICVETYFFLLTCDQFELLWTQQFTKDLWVHGPPGAGKTVAAVQFIQELRRSGCIKEEILYLAENDMLCSYVRSYNMCMVYNRREFLAILEDCLPGKGDYKTNPLCRIENVIVDEAQNFKARDGDWYTGAYTLVKQLTKRKSNQKSNKHKTGFFWVFMDYAQKVHKFEAGLPSIVGKNNFMLSEVSRNSKEIFDYAMHFMKPEEKLEVKDKVMELKRVESLPKLGHDYKSGKGVDVVPCKSDQVKEAISKVLTGIIESGVDINDIAILVGKQQDKERMGGALSDITKDMGIKENITMDTVKRFSGLDKPTVIGVNPRCNEEHAHFDKFVLSLATRARDNLVIISSSENAQKKLKVD